MIYYALLSLAAAAVLGLFLTANIFQGKLAPWAISLVHAALAATGLVLVLLSLLSSKNTIHIIGFGILVIAALGGFYLGFIHLRKKVAPAGIVTLHAGMAIIGFVIITGNILGYF